MTYSELRASDAERERVITFLREHALLGRLSDDELEERIGLAYASVTVGDLERLIADLPRSGRTTAPRRPAPRPQPRAVAHHRKGPSPALLGIGAGALLLTGLPIVAFVGVVAIVVALVAVVFALSVVFGPLLLIALLIIATARRRRPQRRQHMRWGPTTY
jgi:Flp pilus assembly protein TadB